MAVVEEELRGIRLMKVGVTKAQWLKTLYSKARVLAKYGRIQDAIHFDYEANRDVIFREWENRIDEKHARTLREEDSKKGFWGNFTHYRSKPEGARRVDQLINIGNHVLYLQPRWFQRNPGLLAFMNAPTSEGRKIIDFDLHNTIEDLDHGNSVLGEELSGQYVEGYKKMVAANLKGGLMGLGEVRDFYEIVTQCLDVLRKTFAGAEEYFWSGGGFQLLGDWKTYSKFAAEYVVDGKSARSALDPSNLNPIQFMRLLSPMLYKGHLTTSTPINDFEDFRYANPAFYVLPDINRTALSEFEYSWKSNSMFKLEKKMRVYDRYRARRAYQLRLAEEMGIDVNMPSDPAFIEAFEAMAI